MNNVHPIFSDILKTFAPIAPPAHHPEMRPPSSFGLTEHMILEPARVQPDYAGMDDVGLYSETMHRSQNYGPIGSHRAMSASFEPDECDSEVESAADLELTERIKPTPHGHYVGIAMDACAALAEIVRSCRIPANYDQFSEVDVDKWAAICARAGYRL